MHDHIADAVGQPDLVRTGEGLVCLRFETMKIVSALAAVRHLLDNGTIRPGDTLVDSSSGVYAYALALASHKFGMRCHIVGSTTVDHSLRTQLAVLGARLEQVESTSDVALDQRRRVQRVQELLAEHPGYHWMRQYHDQIHYLGYRAAAELVARELDVDTLTLVGGVGSGASTGALATYLREHLPRVSLVGVQPFGSITFGGEQVHDPDIIVAGIGSSIPFGNVAHSLYDTIHWISFDAAVAGSIDLLRRHAIFAGLSTGASYLAARWERRCHPAQTVLFVAADTGHRYVDTVFARHREAIAIEELRPRQISTPGDVALPWSRLSWDHAAGPDRARYVRDGEPPSRTTGNPDRPRPDQEECAIRDSNPKPTG